MQRALCARSSLKFGWLALRPRGEASEQVVFERWRGLALLALVLARTREHHKNTRLKTPRKAAPRRIGRNMILTQCAVCATELGLVIGQEMRPLQHTLLWARMPETTLGRGGHDQLCKKIKKAGGAEQYNANKKYAEAVAVAAEKCADDTKGQTCYICTQALHWKTKEGLVRGCACRGTAGFAHVSCLAEQAKILVAEAEENNLGSKAKGEWARWDTCSLCKQQCHGCRVVHALGWACWKTYLGRPEADRIVLAGDQRAWERLIRCKSQRGRVDRDGGRVGYVAARWRIRRRHAFSSCRAISRAHMVAWDGRKTPRGCEKTYTPGI